MDFRIQGPGFRVSGCPKYGRTQDWRMKCKRRWNRHMETGLLMKIKDYRAGKEALF